LKGEQIAARICCCAFQLQSLSIISEGSLNPMRLDNPGFKTISKLNQWQIAGLATATARP